MCTSLTYQTEANDLFLARTMDFSQVLDGRPVFLPRQFNSKRILVASKQPNMPSWEQVQVMKMRS